MSTAARARMEEKYRWEMVMDKLEAVYKSV
jgi:hypothetical protein